MNLLLQLDVVRRLVSLLLVLDDAEGLVLLLLAVVDHHGDAVGLRLDPGEGGCSEEGRKTGPFQSREEMRRVGRWRAS